MFEEVLNFPKVSIIILNWNEKEYLRKCLDSVLKTDYPNFEVIVVDNASVDGSKEMVKKEYSKVILIENKKNLGFCVGNNIGIKKARGDIIILLNNDTIVDKNWLKEIVKKANNTEVGIIGCKLYFPNSKTIQTVGFREAILDYWESIGAGQTDNGQFKEVEEVDWVSGAALAIKREVIERIGLLDPEFYAFGEDRDLCYRARKAGYKVVTSNAIVYHYGSLSWDKFPVIKMYLTNRNRLYFIIKHYSPRILLRYVFEYPIKSFNADLRRLIKGETVLQKVIYSRQKGRLKVFKVALKTLTLKNVMFLASLLLIIIRRRKSRDIRS